MNQEKLVGLDLVTELASNQYRQGTIEPFYSIEMRDLFRSTHSPTTLASLSLELAIKQTGLRLDAVYKGEKIVEGKKIYGQALARAKATLKAINHEEEHERETGQLDVYFEILELGDPKQVIKRGIIDSQTHSRRESLTVWSQIFEEHKQLEDQYDTEIFPNAKDSLEQMLTLAYVCDLHRDEINQHQLVDEIMNTYYSLRKLLLKPNKGSRALARTGTKIGWALSRIGYETGLGETVDDLTSGLEELGESIAERTGRTIRKEDNRLRNDPAIIGVVGAALVIAASAIYGFVPGVKENVDEMLLGTNASIEIYQGHKNIQLSPVIVEAIKEGRYDKKIIEESEEELRLVRETELKDSPSSQTLEQLTRNIIVVTTEERVVDGEKTTLQYKPSAQGLIISNQGLLVLPTHLVEINGNEFSYDPTNQRAGVTVYSVPNIKRITAMATLDGYNQNLTLAGIDVEFGDTIYDYQAPLFLDSNDLNAFNNDEYNAIYVSFEGNYLTEELDKSRCNPEQSEYQCQLTQQAVRNELTVETASCDHILRDNPFDPIRFSCDAVLPDGALIVDHQYRIAGIKSSTESTSENDRSIISVIPGEAIPELVNTYLGALELSHKLYESD